MSTVEANRRELLVAGAALAALAVGSEAIAQPVAPPQPAFTPQPLPFDAASLGWLSEKLITSHHANNYTGAVTRLGAIRGEIGKLDMAKAPGFQLNGLKREELIAWNSMILHEIYFARPGEARGHRTRPRPGDRARFWQHGPLGRGVLRDGQGARRRLGLGAADLVGA